MARKAIKPRSELPIVSEFELGDLHGVYERAGDGFGKLGFGQTLVFLVPEGEGWTSICHDLGGVHPLRFDAHARRAVAGHKQTLRMFGEDGRATDLALPEVDGETFDSIRCACISRSSVLAHVWTKKEDGKTGYHLFLYRENDGLFSAPEHVDPDLFTRPADAGSFRLWSVQAAWDDTYFVTALVRVGGTLAYLYDARSNTIVELPLTTPYGFDDVSSAALSADYVLVGDESNMGFVGGLDDADAKKQTPISGAALLLRRVKGGVEYVRTLKPKRAAARRFGKHVAIDGERFFASQPYKKKPADKTAVHVIAHDSGELRYDIVLQRPGINAAGMGHGHLIWSEAGKLVIAKM